MFLILFSVLAMSSVPAYRLSRKAFSMDENRLAVFKKEDKTVKKEIWYDAYDGSILQFPVTAGLEHEEYGTMTFLVNGRNKFKFEEQGPKHLERVWQKQLPDILHDYHNGNLRKYPVSICVCDPDDMNFCLLSSAQIRELFNEKFDDVPENFGQLGIMCSER